jgi:hypothetical protein
MLKKQVEALIDMGFDKKLKVVAGQLWFAALRQLNIAFTNKPNKESRKLFVNGEKHKLPLAQKRKQKQKAERKVKVSKLAQSVSDSSTTDDESETLDQHIRTKRKVAFHDKANSSHLNRRVNKKVSFSDTLNNLSESPPKTDDSMWDNCISNEEPPSPYKCSDTDCLSSDDSFSDVEIPSALKDAMKDVTKKNGINTPLEKRSQSKCRRLLSMCSELPLVICYVALLCLRQNVIEIDIVRWVRSQKLPFLDMMSYLPPHMQMTGLGMHNYFRPYVCNDCFWWFIMMLVYVSDFNRLVQRLVR